MNTLRLPTLINPADIQDATQNAIPDEMVIKHLQLLGYGLLTMEIFYKIPDYKNVLNTFLWQFHDVTPHFPRMKAFLAFWENEIEAPIHSVRYIHEHTRVRGEITVATPV